MTVRTSILRNTLFSSAGIYVEYFLGMLAAIVVARQLGPADFGVYGLFLWFAAAGIIVTNAGVSSGVTKFVAELRGIGEEARIMTVIRHMRRAQLWHLVVVVGVAVILYVVAYRQSSATMHDVEFVLLLLAMGVRTFYRFNIAVAKGFEAFDAAARIAWVAAPVNLGLVVIAALLEGSILWFLVVYAVSGVLFLAVSQYEAHGLMRELPVRVGLSPKLRGRIRHHLRIVSITVVVGFFIASDVEILFLNMYASATAAGYFKVAYQLGTGLALLVPGVFGALLLPLTTRALAEGGHAARDRFVSVTSYLALLAAPVMVFGLCFADDTIALLYGSTYAAAAPVLTLVVLAACGSTISQSASSLLIGADRQRTILVLTVVFGVLKVGLDVVLILHFGLMGAATAITAASLAQAIVFLWLGMRLTKTQLDWVRLLRIAMAGAAAALASVPVLELGLAPVWTVFVGGAVMAGVYALGTVLLGCWDRSALQQVADLHLRVTGGRPRAFGRLLAWACARSRAGGHG